MRKKDVFALLGLIAQIILLLAVLAVIVAPLVLAVLVIIKGLWWMLML